MDGLPHGERGENDGTGVELFASYYLTEERAESFGVTAVKGSCIREWGNAECRFRGRFRTRFVSELPKRLITVVSVFAL